ncbi:o-succinylbenzoate--CoA ligase [Amycolatopsis palatopharyngis]|uniref:o-succinylbenzoate--CoA ligase n=1 Tax=Amycolatopsis palatopharyngis TaxID=187982 RepID=UPI000E231DFE|nr:o-succinylbenzoate--CoA ligase [Amycolatopsis palatopharyngis]
MHEVWTDSGPESVRELMSALETALDGGPAVLPLDSRSPGAGAVRDAMEPGTPVEPSTAVIVPTSGSTGAPKGVLLSAAALTASATATIDRLGGPGRWLLATPAHYVGGLQVLVRGMLAGHEPTVLDTSSGFDPSAFAEAARAHQRLPGPHYTALVPTQLARLLSAGEDAVSAAAGFDAIVLGGAALDDRLRSAALWAGISVISAYGMSETASGCVYDGVPLTGVRVRLDTGGRVELAGPMLAHGYRLRPDLTATTFTGGWFRTSDLGRLHDDGRLEILGRADDVINTGGVKIAAAAVERVLTADPGVAMACVVGLPDPEWGESVAAVVVPTGSSSGGEELHSRLLAGVRAELGRAAVPKRLEFNAELPLRGPGKVDREAVRGRLAG